MCLSIPARIVEITQGEMPMAQVDVAGRAESCCLSYVPDAAVNDYVLVQHGFAIELLDPQAAAESLAAFAALGLVPESSIGETSPAPEGLGQVRYAQAARSERSEVTRSEPSEATRGERSEVTCGERSEITGAGPAPGAASAQG